MSIIGKDRMEIIKTICSVVSAMGVLLAACGLWFQIRVWTDYHERARSDRAISLLSELSKSLTVENRAVQKLEANLGHEKLKKLKVGERFSIDANDRDLLDFAVGRAIPSRSQATNERGKSRDTGALKIQTGEDRIIHLALSVGANDIGASKKQTGEYTLTRQESFALRWQIASYLNAVEIVCQAAMSDAANTKIIEKQLSGLFDREKRFTFCENYRGAVDGPDHASYPAIHHFVTKVLGDKTQDSQIGGGY